MLCKNSGIVLAGVLNISLELFHCCNVGLNVGLFPPKQFQCWLGARASHRASSFGFYPQSTGPTVASNLTYVKSWRYGDHPSIQFLYPLNPIQVRGEDGACPSCYWQGSKGHTEIKKTIHAQTHA